MTRAIHDAGIQLDDPIGIRQTADSDRRVLNVLLFDSDALFNRVQQLATVQHDVATATDGRLRRRPSGDETKRWGFRFGGTGEQSEQTNANVDQPRKTTSHHEAPFIREKS
jgi:hypothetical protein